MTIASYPTVYAIGHKAIERIFSDPVVVEEKIDGSQISFGVSRETWELECRSKGKQLILDAPEKMFIKAIEGIRDMESSLRLGWVYRCEFLAKPKHNTLSYSRVPAQHLILFDVSIGEEEYLSPELKRKEAERLGLECVPLLYEGIVADFAQFNEFLERESILGGTKVEGIVVKNYSLFTREKKVAMGKYVSEKFKEIHSVEWRKSNPTKGDIIDGLIAKYRTEARWNKAIQHLRERGQLDESPRDIGNLIKEVSQDTDKECQEEIKQTLYRHFWPKIQRGITAGLPEWYKEELAKKAFGEKE